MERPWSGACSGERCGRLGGNKEAKVASFVAKQQLPYEVKVPYAYKRAWEFYRECGKRGLDCHVSVGGLDSIVLYLWLRSIGIVVPAISVSSMEHPGNRKIHKALGVEALKPSVRKDGTRWTRQKVLQELGFPILSKEVATKINHLQHPHAGNATIRHAIVTGVTGSGNKSSKIQLAQKWLKKFAGGENEREGTDYQEAPSRVRISAKCCYYLKEKPCRDWAKEHNSVPYMGLMASEGGSRQQALRLNGCNYFGQSTIRSCPFAIFSRQDLLRLALEMEDWYQEHWQKFGTGIHLDTIVPEAYGVIARRDDGTLYTTKAQRTGCDICGFGSHLETRPNRWDETLAENPAKWEYWMYRCCADQDGQYGWGVVLDYCGIGWRPETLQEDIDRQRAKAAQKRARQERQTAKAAQMTWTDMLQTNVYGGENGT